MPSLVDTVKDTIVGTIRGTGEIVNAVTETVSDSLITALKGSGSVSKAPTNLWREGGHQGAIQVSNSSPPTSSASDRPLA